MRLIVSKVLGDAGHEERTTIGEYSFLPSEEHPSAIAISERVAISDLASVQITASFDPSTRQLFAFMKEGNLQIFSAVGVIGEGIQYYAIRVSDGTFTELSFEE